MNKNYQIQPNEQQREALKRAFRVTVIHEEAQGREVTIKTSDYYKDGSLLAEIIVNGRLLEARKIGPRGGITLV